MPDARCQMPDETRHIFIQHPETSIQHRLLGEGGLNGYLTLSQKSLPWLPVGELANAVGWAKPTLLFTFYFLLFTTFYYDRQEYKNFASFASWRGIKKNAIYALDEYSCLLKKDQGLVRQAASGL